MSGFEYLIGLAKSDVDAGRDESVSVVAGLLAAAGADAAVQVEESQGRLDLLQSGVESGRVQIVRIR